MLQECLPLCICWQLGMVDKIVPDDVVVQVFRGDTVKPGNHAFEARMV